MFTSQGAPPVSVTPVKNLPLVPLVFVLLCQWYRRQICRRGPQFAASVIDTDYKLPPVFIYMLTQPPKGVQTK